MVYIRNKASQPKFLREMLGKTTLNSSMKSTDLKKLLLRHRFDNTDNKPAVMLPPVNCSLKNKATTPQDKISISQELKKAKYLPTLVITREKTSTQKPIYFCQPLSLSMKQKERINLAKKQQKQESTKDEVESFITNKTKNCKEPFTNSRNNNKKASKNKDSSERRTSEKFREFCLKEGVNFSGPAFKKASKCFKGKKFSRVSRPPPLWMIPETDSMIAEDDAQCQSTTAQTSDHQRIKRSTKQTIKDKARRSADQGKSAASRALRFVSDDQRHFNQKRVTLPPLQRSALHSLTTTWNPDVSVLVSKVT